MNRADSTKKWVMLLAVAGMLFPLVTVAENIEPRAAIKKVTVFTDRALIEKEMTVELKRGENIIRIPKLTSWLVNESLQIGLPGQNDVTISEVVIEDALLKDTERPEVQKLQSQLDELNRQINEANNRKSVIASSNDFYQRTNPFPNSQRVTATDMEAHTRYLEKMLMENYGRMATIDGEIKKLNDRKAVVESELGNLSPGTGSCKNIIVRLQTASDKSSVPVGLSYITLQSGWAPQYEIRAASAVAKMSFTYFATIWQSTGEDWSQANIEISTARPFVYGNPPKLTGWYLDAWQPRPYMMKSAQNISVRGYSDEAMPAPAPVADASLLETIVVREESTSFSFVFPRKVDIISDGKPHRVQVAAADADAELAWFTAPKMVQQAFLKATVKNPFSFPMLSGSMSVFLDQRLVGNSFIGQSITSGDKMELSLGVDEGVKIERKLENKFTDHAGMLSKENKVLYEYTIEVTNSKGKAVELELKDQFPVSRNEKIKIEPIAPKGGDSEVDNEGIITWKLKLQPGEKISVPLKFSVTYPKDMTVSGLY